jgi:hypothetical protein
MTPDDVRVFVKTLESKGLVFIQDEKAMDLVAVDQFGGITRPCDWLEFGHVQLSNSDERVAACRLSGSDLQQLITPEGWEYKESLSDKYCFVSSEYVEEDLKFLRHENGLDVFLNLLTHEEVYLGRTSK